MIKLKGSLLEILLESGIFGIVNNRNKSIYIGYSHSMLESINRNLSQIKDQVHTCIPHTSKVNNLQVLIIETCTKDQLKLKQSYWISEYRNKGYKIYNTRKPLTYRTRIVIDEDYKVLVQLVNLSKDSFVIGVFNKVQEAVDFTNEVKKTTPIVPIYATNDLTKQYLIDHKINFPIDNIKELLKTAHISTFKERRD